MSACLICEKNKNTSLTNGSQDGFERLKRCTELRSESFSADFLKRIKCIKWLRNSNFKWHLPCYKNAVNYKRQREDDEHENIVKSRVFEIEKSVIHESVENKFVVELRHTLSSSSEILSMVEIENIFKKVGEAEKVKPHLRRHQLKELLILRIPDVEFHRSKIRNEAEYVTCKEGRNAAVLKVIELKKTKIKEDIEITENSFEIIKKASLILRKAVVSCDVWQFEGSLINFDSKYSPEELRIFFKMLIAGTLVDETPVTIIKNVNTLSQLTISMVKTNRSIAESANVVYNSKVVPLQVAIGLTVHQFSRSRKVIDLLYSYGLSIEYGKVLRLETQLAESVIQNMSSNDGIFVPSTFVKNRRVFFAIDNADFCEDTPDGKNTSHVTAISIYQKKFSSDEDGCLNIVKYSRNKTIDHTNPNVFTEILEAYMPKSPKPIIPEFPFYMPRQLNHNSSLVSKDLPWILAKTLNINESGSTNYIKTWSAHNAILDKSRSLTRICLAPLVPAPAHEFSTLLTTLKIVQGISTHVIPGGKTVVSMDLGLYVPAKQLQLSRNDLNNIILRPGELHITMAVLKSIGGFIENTGIDRCWIESGLFGENTVRQILEGKHVKRSIEANMLAFQAFYNLYFERFFELNAHIKKECEWYYSNLIYAYQTKDKEVILAAQLVFNQEIELLNISGKMAEFEDANLKFPVFKTVLQYMQMVQELCLFTRAVRTGTNIL